MLRGLLLVAVGMCWQGLSAPEVQGGERDRKARVLFLTESRGFVHGSVRRSDGELSPAEVAITQLGQQTGLFDVHCTQDTAADFTPGNLENYDIVMFYTSGELPISDEARDYFLNDWLKQKGRGFIGFHSAADTFRTDNPEHAWYWELVGGIFNGHPWNADNTVTITVHDTAHPAMQPFGREFQIRDEIYQYKHWKPENVRVLMSLNMEKTEPKRPYHVPVAWCRAWGEGKVFVNNLGHNESTWTDRRFLRSTEAAIRWILNLEDGEAAPNPDVSAAEERKARAAAQ